MLRAFGKDSSKAWLLVLTVSAGACATVDGSELYAMWGTIEHPQKLFSLRYLKDVWRTAEDSTPQSPVLVVGESASELSEELEAEAPTVFEFEESYRLRASVLGESRDLVKAVVAAEKAWLRQGFHVELGAPLKSAKGAEGWVLHARLDLDKPIFVAQVFHESGGRVVTLEVWGHRSVQTDDMRLLLRGFEPASEDG